jgi:hypothetical protein
MPTAVATLKPISIRNVDPALWTLVNTEASARNQTVSAFVQHALREWLDSHSITTIRRGKK